MIFFSSLFLIYNHYFVETTHDLNIKTVALAIESRKSEMKWVSETRRKFNARKMVRVKLYWP